MILTSAKNPTLQAIRHAAAKGQPTGDGFIVIEGQHLLEEALLGEWVVERIFVTPGAHDRHEAILRESQAEIVEVSGRALTATSATETNQGILALVRPRRWTWNDLISGHSLIVVLDAIQDPGNAGTIVRSAEAFGATGIIFLKGSVRTANGKLLRAAAGSLFRVPVLEGIEVADLVSQASEANLEIYALSPRGQLLLAESDLRCRCLLAVGNEGAGISQELSQNSRSVTIPTGKAESLNAAIACSIALFEAYRQRNTQ